MDEGGEAEVMDEAEGMDMYAGAGPRDLPDGGQDGRGPGGRGPDPYEGGRVALMAGQMARRCRAISPLHLHSISTLSPLYLH